MLAYYNLHWFLSMLIHAPAQMVPGNMVLTERSLKPGTTQHVIPCYSMPMKYREQTKQ